MGLRFWRRWFRGWRWSRTWQGAWPRLEPSVPAPPPMKIDSPSTPGVGDEIYVDTALHLHHGRDNVRGGRARVVAVNHGYHGLKGVLVEVAEHPGDLYNWELLGPRQRDLEREFGDQRARPDPDLRPEFNED